MSESPEVLYSHHIFMLPFKWSAKQGGKAETNLKSVMACVPPAKEGEAGWQQSAFDLDTIARYNEYFYFYDYVSEAMYDLMPDKTTDPFMAHYEYKVPKGKGKYKIYATKYQLGKENEPGEQDNGTPYELEIDSVLLHLYYSGVGVLSFHLNNKRANQNAPEDILKINQYGRRVYPTFYNIPAQKVGTQAQFDESNFAGNVSHGTEIAYKIEVALPGSDQPFLEEWKGTPQNRLKKTGSGFDFKLPGFIEPFLQCIDKNYHLLPVLDDRMFVACWYGSSDRVSDVTATKPGEAGGNWLSSDWWSQYVFVDGGFNTTQNEELRRKLIERATYTRWTNLNTIYGLTEYSLVVLTNDLADLREVPAAFLVTHLQTIYYRMAELVLVQRASIQHFSDEVTHLTRQYDTNANEAKAASELYRRYIRFVNRIYFREITPQVQGIEMYDLLQRQSRIEPQIEGLERELAVIQQLSELKAQKNKEEQEELEKVRWDRLNLIGALFVAPALLLATFALPFYPQCFMDWKPGNMLYVFVAIAISVGLTLWSFNRDRKPEDKKLVDWWIILVIGLMAAGPAIYCMFSGSG